MAVVHKERARVFCASLADVFEDHPSLAAPRTRLFEVIADTRTYAEDPAGLDWLLLTKRPENILRFVEWPEDIGEAVTADTPVSGMWFGTTCEDQQRADERIPHLLAVPAECRFLSCEPLLGPLDLARHLATGGIHWVIVGGESNQGGMKARPFDLDWADQIIGQCRTHNVPVFVKQLGSRPLAPGLGVLRTKDKHGGDIEEFPPNLAIRELPRLPNVK